MVTHMKTTVDIADNLFHRAKARAKERNITLRTLIEEALAGVLDEAPSPCEIQPVTFRGNGLSPEFDGASWDKIRDSIYP